MAHVYGALYAIFFLGICYSLNHHRNKGIGVAVAPKKKYIWEMLLISIALLGWFGFAVGSALGSQFGAEKDSEDSGGFFGMLVGLAVGVYLVFFA